MLFTQTRKWIIKFFWETQYILGLTQLKRHTVAIPLYVVWIINQYPTLSLLHCTLICTMCLSLFCIFYIGTSMLLCVYILFYFIQYVNRLNYMYLVISLCILGTNISWGE